MRRVLPLMALVAGCQGLPDATLRQNDWGRSITVTSDSLVVELHNPIPSPARFRIRSEPLDLDSALVVADWDSVRVRIPLDGRDSTGLRTSVRINAVFGTLDQRPAPGPLALPFPAGRRHRVIQGYRGSFSHNTGYSRFALDLDLAPGDTVSAADHGVVVGVISGYEVGGNDRKFRPYANYITLYHPHSGLYTQYVHLAPAGSFVQVGDSVRRHQPIGLTGLTGFTSTPHLHFNVLVPDSSGGMVSHPVDFEGDLRGESLKPNDAVGTN